MSNREFRKKGRYGFRVGKKLNFNKDVIANIPYKGANIEISRTDYGSVNMEFQMGKNGLGIAMTHEMTDELIAALQAAKELENKNDV